MTAARPLRWLLALAALFVPAAVACRDSGTDTAPRGDAPTDVVFRHYL